MRAVVGVGCVLLAAFGVRAGVEPEVLLEVGPSETVARASEGDLAVLKDGRWLLGYSEFPAKQKGRYAAHHDHAKARIVTRTSSDNGRTWSEPTVAARRFRVSARTVPRNPSDARARPGMRRSPSTPCCPSTSS